MTVIGWKDCYVGIALQRSIMHCEITTDGLQNSQVIDVPESIDVIIIYNIVSF